MNKTIRLINLLLMSSVTTIIVFTGYFMIMLFSSDAEGLRTTLFDAIFFKSEPHPEGGLLLSFGIYTNFVPVFSLFVLSFLSIFSTVGYVYNKFGGKRVCALPREYQTEGPKSTKG